MGLIKLRGIICALVTPMHEDGSVNYDYIPELVDHVLRGGVHGIFTLGTNGELFALSTKEKLAVVREVVKAVGGRVPVLAGCGCESTYNTVRLARAYQELGIAGLSVVTPYFITPSQEELYAHYRVVAESSDLPILLYNIPARTGVSLEPETVAKLSEIHNISGIKDSSGNYEMLLAYRRLTDPDFTVLAGNDGLIYRALCAGADGAIAATANVLPQIVSGIYHSYQYGDLAEAERLQQLLGPLRETFSLGTVPGVLKEAVNWIGLPVGPSRMPILPLRDDKKATFERIMREYYSQYRL